MLGKLSSFSNFLSKEASSGPKSTLSKEEKLKKAKELQDQIRKRREAEDKRLAEEHEKNRI